MIILPAIDIKNGQCVRLKKGDFNTTEKVADDWLSTALGFQAAGAEWIHMVDLDGALGGSPKNADIFIGTARQTGLFVELGGGIRTKDTIAYYLENGIARVVLGSAAISEPALIKWAVKKYGNKIAVGIDADQGMVKSSGWTVGHSINYLELAKQMEEIGVETIIFTDISKDGMLSGPNLKQLSALKRAVRSNIIASGGIKELDDIKTLASEDFYGVICGKSLYQGSLRLSEAFGWLREEEKRRK